MTEQSSQKMSHSSVLTVNGGSSSIKFALYSVDEPLKRKFYGTIDRIGLSGTNLKCYDALGNQFDNHRIAAANHRLAANVLIDWLENQYKPINQNIRRQSVVSSRDS